jgi:hypothetical protein
MSYLGRPDDGHALAVTPQCVIEDCDSPVKARGWCNLHYDRWRRSGHPQTEPGRGRWFPMVWFAKGERIMESDEQAAAIARFRRYEQQVAA